MESCQVSVNNYGTIKRSLTNTQCSCNQEERHDERSQALVLYKRASATPSTDKGRNEELTSVPPGMTPAHRLPRHPECREGDDITEEITPAVRCIGQQCCAS
jgi:hypothetical protein